MNKIIERIEQEAGVPGLAAILAEKLAPTDLQSLMLEVYRLRSNQRKPSQILADYASDRFVRPSQVSLSRLLAWEQSMISALEGKFQVLELSPVCPLGTCASIAEVHQNWAVATARNTEVVSDSTNVLALECALRRGELLRLQPKSQEAVHLAASHRLLRGQKYHNPALLPHFSLFALCSAGRDLGSLRFELATLGLQIRIYLKALRAFLGEDIPLQVWITDFNPNPRQPRIEIELLRPIRREFKNVACGFDAERESGGGYYRDLCFHLHATTASGKPIELVDGGVVNWTQKLLNNAKERLVISGIGNERVINLLPA